MYSDVNMAMSLPPFPRCALPWCYVDSNCPGATATDVFKGSTAAFYSYNVCRFTPDCYGKHEAGCPFDSHDNGYATKMTCRKGSSYSDCSCKFQGGVLNSTIYTNYPIDTPGQYRNMTAIRYYGSSCAAWDRVPDTPWFSYCPSTANFGTTDKNWCTSPWCYVDESCSFGSGSDVFKGSPVAFFSYEACGVNNCYGDTQYTLKNHT